jgi:tRNA pseudouridine55 synthase
MDGVLIIDKPAGITSHDVVARVRRILKTKRVGHTGTLDPFATGVLVLLVGKATRLAQFINDATKEYVAEIRFGFTTDTGDVTGMPTSEEQTVTATPAELEAVLPGFRGEIAQLPPMYSAKKVEGKKLYELARRGETIERQPIKVTIYELALLETHLEGEPKTATMRVTCSAGTYIRTLAEDIGKALGTPAHLTSLRRTAVGKFDLPYAVTLDEFKKERSPWLRLLAWNQLVAHLPQVDLPEERVGPTLNGLSTRVDREDLEDGNAVNMFEPDGSIIAVGFFDASERCVRPKIVLV